MRRGLRWLFLSAFLAGCTGKAEAVRAAQPYIERFDELRTRALSLLELRADIERKRLLAEAAENGVETLPKNLRPVFERMRVEGTTITEEQLREGKRSFRACSIIRFRTTPMSYRPRSYFSKKMVLHPPSGIPATASYRLVFDGTVCDNLEPSRALPSVSPRKAPSRVCCCSYGPETIREAPA